MFQEWLQGPEVDTEAVGWQAEAKRLADARLRPSPCLDHRDRRCRFPGCDITHCDAHHIDHWADGGETKLENLILLCRKHHRAVHEEGFDVGWDVNGDPVF
ncbi:MAG: HNH endonuclease [Thermoanaerobaculia bacterium]|nr:HNH endonuclease [Thermoanaerobaculia bacterium]